MTAPRPLDPAALPAEEVLARTIWGEARGESREGREAVAAVVVNRVRIAAEHRKRFRTPYWWGETPRDVCLRYGQFSCWLPMDPNRAKLLAVTAADPVFAECLEIAREALAGRLADPANGATHYVNASLASPPWVRGQTPSAVIGRHTFFRIG